MNNLPAKPLEKMKAIIAKESVQEQFRNALQDQAPLFIASVVDLFSQDAGLQKCDPGDVLKECLKAATLKLPLSRSLGFAYVVPYNNKPQFQIGYRGLVQLAVRSGQYKHLNADCVYQGESVNYDRVTGEFQITGLPESEEAVGYFAFFELTNGFRKSLYWTRQQVEAHARRFSRSFNNKNSAWQTDFDAMAKKTVLRALLTKYGLLSIEMIGAMPVPETQTMDEIRTRANHGELMDLPGQEEEVLLGEVDDSPREAEAANRGPGF